jgi:hypothetical protein
MTHHPCCIRQENPPSCYRRNLPPTESSLFVRFLSYCFRHNFVSSCTVRYVVNEILLTIKSSKVSRVSPSHLGWTCCRGCIFKFVCCFCVVVSSWIHTISDTIIIMIIKEIKDDADTVILVILPLYYKIHMFDATFSNVIRKNEFCVIMYRAVCSR